MENELKPDWYAKSLTWKSPEELTYFNHLGKKINWNNPRDIYRLIKKNYYAHNEFREKNCINLIASENLMSPLARKYLGSNLGFRVCDGPVGKKIFGSGIQFLEEIEAICIETARKLFGAKYVEHRLLSGTMGCMARALFRSCASMEITFKKLLGIFWLLNALFHLYRISLLLESLGQEFFFNNLFFKILYTYILIVYFSYFIFIYTEKNIKIDLRYKINLLIGLLGVPLLVYYFYFMYLEIIPLSLGQYLHFIFYKEPLALWSFIQNILLLITISVFIKDGYLVSDKRED